mgnify:FL=1
MMNDSMKRLRVLIACECSQTVCERFRALGDECYSCDVVDQYGGHPEWHIMRDVRDLLDGDCAFETRDGAAHYVDAWDLIIAHPPCTYLSRTQNQLYDRERLGDEYVDNRIACRERAVAFFLRFARVDCPCAIENPVGCMSRRYRPPTQVIQPYEYGDPATKPTCLWLRGLPRLVPTRIVPTPPAHRFPSSNSMGAWYYATSKLPAKDRARARSKTFPGIAAAMAAQWHAWLAEPFRLVP